MATMAAMTPVIATLAALPALAAGHAVHRTMVVGHSVDGRPIVAVETGVRGRPKVLVVGCIHGNECAGIAVVRRLRRRPTPRGADLWLVPSMNPDGRAAGTRQKARIVGLPLLREQSPGGAASRWQRHRFPNASAFAVELPAGPLTAGGVRRHVAAGVGLAPRRRRGGGG